MAADFSIWPGKPAPLGNSATADGVNFALFSAHAQRVDVCLFDDDGRTELARLPLPGRTNDIWHGFVPGLKDGQLYGYRVHGPYAPADGHRFNPHKLLIDPYAKMLAGDFTLDPALYGFDQNSAATDLSFDARDSAPYMPKCMVGDIRPAKSPEPKPGIPWTETILYEAHVKGATHLHGGIAAKLRGTFEGLAAPNMIRHLTDLGVTSIELLPVQAFFSEPRLTELGLTNYWGYNTISFFAPHAAYMGPAGVGSFQKMVRTLHKAGIEVILDVVYNHTAESWELGPTLSMRGIDNASYYRLADGDARYYSNETGCGNALNMDHPFVLKLVMDSLRYWVEVMGVDGFRFDLATTLSRENGTFNGNSAFLRALRQDPILARVKLIAEPWDIGNDGYQLGQFPNIFGEWNDRYRDTVRRFWRGERFVLPDLADALLGSASLFGHNGNQSFRSINFLTSHDGFTLSDTVSYNDRHNWANGEENRDGHSNNHSDNCGVEGPTDDPEIMARRAKRQRNLLATLMVSQGTPMMLAGDERGNSQNGNNNAYCQDNEISWLNWPGYQGDGLEDFCQKLIGLRKSHPVLSRATYLHGRDRSPEGLKDVTWISEHGDELQPDEWHHQHRHSLGMMLTGTAGDHVGPQGQHLTDTTLLVLFNNGVSDVDFQLPLSGNWSVILDTHEIDAFRKRPAAKAVSLVGESIIILECDGTGLSRTRVADGVSDLATHYGIVDSFYDLAGTNRIASQESKKALLGAMGVKLDTQNDLDAALAKKHQEETAVIPPTLVLTQGTDLTIPVQLPAEQQATALSWTIELENGKTIDGTSALIPAGAPRANGGQSYQSYRCQLSAVPPLGYHRLSVSSPVRAACHLIMAPDKAESLRHSGKQWGLTVPLYGLKSATNLGIGDFDDLARVAEFAAAQGADFIGINPVHALFPKRAHNCSPYSPSSRTFLNIMHIAPHLIPELSDDKQGKEFLDSLLESPQAQAARDSDLVDYQAVGRLKFQAYEEAFRIFDALPQTSPRQQAFANFCNARGDALEKHALFDALSEHFLEQDPALLLWQQWPPAYRDPASVTVQEFANRSAARVRFFKYMQWVADTQLTDAQTRSKAAGMSIGIYLDLAVGMVPGGAETWTGSKAVATGVSLGAPPDAASPAGQVWDLAPLNPHRLEESGYRHFISTIRSIMAQSGLVRIDHILGINRSYWCPDNRSIPGAYVNYPLDDLISIIALESVRSGCAVIGEDMGTVPDGLRPKLNAANIFGCALMYFEQDTDGHFIRPEDYRASTLASISNHDFPTLAGYWSGQDFAWRRALGIGDDPRQMAIDEGKRFADKCHLMAMLAEHNLLPAGLDPNNPPDEITHELSVSMHALLGRTRSLVAACQLEDLLCLQGQPNVPGTTDEQPNWRRKIPVSVENLETSTLILDHIEALESARQSK